MVKFFLGLALTMFVSNFAFATASSVVQSSYKTSLSGGQQVSVQKLVVTASSVDGSVADVTVTTPLHGYLLKVGIKPGSTTPTAGYSIALTDPDSGADALNNQMAAISATAASNKYPVGASGASPLWLSPSSTYLLHITNNSVDSAVFTIWLYMVDPPAARLL